MKSAQKILALILAGVMALALLTGCGKATSLNRTMAEGIAEYHKSSYVRAGNKNNIRFPNSAVISPPCLMKPRSLRTRMGLMPLPKPPKRP